MLLLQDWAWERIKTLSPIIESLTPKDIAAGHGFLLAKMYILILNVSRMQMNFDVQC